MIIIPELAKIVLMVPRTGTGSLKRALLAKYPDAFMPYRHMEACGVPRGYEFWPKVGVVRHPVDRLWSLYKFTKDYRSAAPDQDQEYIDALRESADMPFSDWILKNQQVFTCPFDHGNKGRYWPKYTVNHALPENRKSQWLTLRPDLGTHIWSFENLESYANHLGVKLDRHNSTEIAGWPDLTAEAKAYVDRVFAWDRKTWGEL